MTTPERLWVALFGLVLLAGASIPALAVDTGRPVPTIDALFASYDQPGSPGCALGVSRNGALIFARGYGEANLDHGIPITPQTVFDVASITKQFVAANLTLLDQEGALSLDDDVRRWLPELPDHGTPVTLTHMIHHTSGLRDYLNLFPLAGRDDYFPISQEQILDMMARQRALNFEPGERYQYSNTAYMLLAQVLERASGKRLGELAQDRQFGPLGMSGSLMYDDREMIIPGRATGYGPDPAGGWREVHNDNFDAVGDGQMYSTVEDLLRWDHYLHGDKPEIYAQMMREGRLNDGQPTRYAQGLELYVHRGLKTVGHSGSSWGFRSQLVRFTDAGLAIAITCNVDGSRPWDLAMGVAEHYLGEALGPLPDVEKAAAEPATPEPDPTELDAAQLAGFTGEFFSPELDATYRLSNTVDGLVLRIEQGAAVTVSALARDSFSFPFKPDGWGSVSTVTLRFDRGADGAVAGFQLAAGDEQGIVFEKRSPRPFLIVNAQVIDGSGAPSRTADVRLAGDRIVAVGDLTPGAGEGVIDAEGRVLAPGFVDTHSHHEEALERNPGALGAVSQGITTILAGQDGGHAYPLRDFFARLEAAPVAINVASMAGFGTLRGEVMGRDYQRPASPREQATMLRLLAAELDAGAMGLSSGLEYDPGSFSSTDEIIALAKMASERGGGYISHIRSEDTLFWEAIDEAVRIGREAGIPVRVTHVKLALARWWGQTARLLDTLEAAREAGVDITVDLYPYRAWNTHFSWLATQFPDRDLGRREGAEFILNDMLSPDTILLGSYPPEPALGGMTIAEIAELRESDPETVLVDLLRDDMATGARADMLGFAMNEDDMGAIMAWPHAVIASDGELEGSHPRGFGTFARFLGHYVRERQLMSLEEAIRRITALPAGQVGIEGRGSIRPGAYADLVLFDPDTITDRATYESPRQPSAGVDKVWVNGELVFDGGAVTGRRPGKVLRRSAP